MVTPGPVVTSGTCASGEADNATDFIINTYIKILYPNDIKGVYKYTGKLNKGRPIYNHITNSKLHIIYDEDGSRPQWLIKNKNTVLYKHPDSFDLEPPRDTWDNTSLNFSKDLNCNIKSYTIQNYKNKNLEPKFDIFIKQYKAISSSKPDYDDKNKFNLLIENNYYYIKNKKLDMFLSIDNLENIVFSKIGSKFEIIPHNNKYVIKVLHENKLLTFEKKLVIQNSINIESPNDNQVFNFSELNITNKLYQQVGYYKASTQVSINDPNYSNNNNNIMCSNDEYLSQLYKNQDPLNNLKYIGKCSKIQNTDNYEKLQLFFNLPTTDFKHTHDFIANDKLHSISEGNILNTNFKGLNFIDEKSNNSLELYSQEKKEFLNNIPYDVLTPIQKIFYIMIMLKINNVENININYNSVYKFFKDQTIQDTVYGDLLKNTPTTTSSS
jgi:hypothetical protein